MINRREFAAGCLALGGAALLEHGAMAAEVGAALPPWSPGELDIHQIDTGRGNASFLIGPDGMTRLIDCGASKDGPDSSAPCRPNASRRPGEWVARYALRATPGARGEKLGIA